MNRLGQLLRNFRRKLIEKYILPNRENLTVLNQVPAMYTAIVNADDWVNFVNYTASDEFKVLISHFLFKFKYLSHLLFPYILVLYYISITTSKRLMILCCKVKSAASKVARSNSLYPHSMGRGGYALVIAKMVTLNIYTFAFNSIILSFILVYLTCVCI
jgi:hypothetical protein